MQGVGAIGAAQSGINAALQDMAASADNLANLRTAKSTDGPAFQGEQVIHVENPTGGVSTEIAPRGTAEGVVMSEPEHPDADAAGNVRYPNIDIGTEMVNILVAQRTIEANVATIKSAVDSSRELLSITSKYREQLAASPG